MGRLFVKHPSMPLNRSLANVFFRSGDIYGCRRTGYFSFGVCSEESPCDKWRCAEDVRGGRATAMRILQKLGVLLEPVGQTIIYSMEYEPEITK